MPDTPSNKYDFVRPADGDPIHDWPQEMRDTIDGIDGIIASWSDSNPRPAAGLDGRIHRHPSTGVISVDDGTAWHDLALATDLAAAVLTASAGGVPIGGEISYAGGSLPAGTVWAWEDGGLIDKTTFALFFSAVGHAFNGGVDPGSNKVRLPDKRGRVTVGADNMGTGAAGVLTANGARGDKGGFEKIAIAAPEMPLHSHTPTDPTHRHGLLVGSALGGGGNGILIQSLASAALDPGYMATVGTGITIGNAGSGSAHNNMQPHQTSNMIVRVA